MVFKRIDCVGSWIAVVNLPAVTSLELPEGVQGQLSNEGVVVGLGKEVRDKGLLIGDRVILGNRRPTVIDPKTGDYEGMLVYMVQIGDILIRKPKGDIYTIDESEFN